MSSSKIDAFIIPSDDPHLSEYPADCFTRRAFISGFTGSAGTVIITQSEKLLWTDGRYFLQAEDELDETWKVMKQGMTNVPTLVDWLVKNVSRKGTVGIDPLVHSSQFYTELQSKLKGSDVRVLSIGSNQQNPIDSIWGKDRPNIPNGKVRIHPMEFAGETVGSKLEKIRKEMERVKAGALPVCLLDEIAYILNIRGEDVEHNPVVISYLVITDETCEIFISDSKLSPAVEEYFKSIGVAVNAYENVLPVVENLGKEEKSIWVDPSKVNAAIWLAVPNSKRMTKVSPISMAKAVKNSAELEGMRNAHVRDGAAMAEFLCFLEKELKSGRKITEYEIDSILTSHRSKRDFFLDQSFPTIAGYGSNGAIIHYRAKKDHSKVVEADSLFLLDSGAQYLDGTTDVTRTMHFGEPSEEEKKAFSLVLKGNIGIDTAVFPEGTPGCLIDAFARRALWKHGMDFSHGTGHGVGAALNVHEGPHSISPRLSNTTPLKPGMIVSNEPGFYLSGKFGIRIENLLEVKRTALRNEELGKDFYAFESLTLIPIQKNLINVGLMSDDELDWLDRYHATVWDKVSGFVDEETKEWLRDRTLPIAR
eukprot:CAMPEP_0171461600 /NCGR_PEP_ID=MMETSP0945-20130129/5981_1 /TAXON_ID=109269 /ORGANISM="Vaucheria litorea, Strain CCMP2940" /LENGTH=590 /DNA_ID=CAMNT_0011987975 /DNA_START=258 /DNA_END=2030 /DNA_ORIENTATION=-